MDKALETLVAETAHSLGYDAKLVPGKQFVLSDSYLGSKFQPDVLIRNGDRKAIVVVMGGFIGLGLVNLTDRSRRETGAGALICVPDPGFSKLSKDTKSYANDLNVRLCPLSGVGDALKELLEQPAPTQIAGDRDR